MKHLTSLITTLCFALLMGLTASAFGAEDNSLREALRTQVFASSVEALRQANAANAAVLTPETYRKGSRAYLRAEEAFDGGADVNRVASILEEANKEFLQAATMAPTVETFVSAAFQARSDALAADAKKRAPKLWEEAEIQLYEAASRAEKGREGRVSQYADKAEKLYRDAELEAIETVLFTEIETEIAKAKKLDADDWAETSYQKAIDLLALARSTLAGSRYDTDQPRNLAKQAMHNALYAQYVSRLADDIDDNDTTLEAILLEWQAILEPLGESVDVPLYFDNGPAASIELVVAAIEERARVASMLAQDLSSARQSLRLLEDELASTQAELENREEAKARLDRRLALQAQQEKTVSRVESLFSKTEAEVVRAENRLIIRMVGLNFSFGSAELEPQHEAILSKLINAISEFPETPITIEGHTDSYGADATNMTLSVKRAESVAAYLLERVAIAPSQLSSVGYGETKPIANNETADGRSKNRRIDVVLYPSFWSN
jgi:OmpA-OmpF porin, OOP family